MTTSGPQTELSWRIPDESAPQRFRIGALHILIASLFFGAIVWGAAPRDMRLPALAAMLPLAAFLWWRNWRKSGASSRQPDNVRLDAQGLTWLDSAGNQHLLARESVESFRIGEDDETVRSVPALMLTLVGGYESQPVELHEPVTPEQVRGLLFDDWKLREQTSEEHARKLLASAVTGVEFSLDVERGVWELRGPRQSLLACCDRLAELGEKLAAFPAGARPLALHLGGSVLRFSPDSVAESAVVETDFFGTRDDLLALAANLGTKLEAAEVGTTFDAPVFADAPEVWSVVAKVQQAT